MRTRVKICGITNIEDAEAAVDFGTDALGFIFYNKSPRNITLGKAQSIIKALPPFVTTVAVVVNSTTEEINEIMNYTGCRVLQYHGNITPISRTINFQVIPAISISSNDDLKTIQQYDNYPTILLDTKKDGQYGGTGETFDWSMADKIQTLNKKIILAGGISIDNVAEAIRLISPWAVDVNSKIENEPGKKNHEQMKKFFEIIQSL